MSLPKIVCFLPYPEEYLLTYLTRNVDPSEFEFVGSQLLSYVVVGSFSSPYNVDSVQDLPEN